MSYGNAVEDLCGISDEELQKYFVPPLTPKHIEFVKDEYYGFKISPYSQKIVYNIYDILGYLRNNCFKQEKEFAPYKSSFAKSGTSAAFVKAVQNNEKYKNLLRNVLAELYTKKGGVEITFFELNQEMVANHIIPDHLLQFLIQSGFLCFNGTVGPNATEFALKIPSSHIKRQSYPYLISLITSISSATLEQMYSYLDWENFEMYFSYANKGLQEDEKFQKMGKEEPLESDYKSWFLWAHYEQHVQYENERRVGQFRGATQFDQILALTPKPIAVILEFGRNTDAKSKFDQIIEKEYFNYLLSFEKSTSRQFKAVYFVGVNCGTSIPEKESQKTQKTKKVKKVQKPPRIVKEIYYQKFKRNENKLSSQEDQVHIFYNQSIYFIMLYILEGPTVQETFKTDLIELEIKKP